MFQRIFVLIASIASRLGLVILGLSGPLTEGLSEPLVEAFPRVAEQSLTAMARPLYEVTAASREGPPLTSYSPQLVRRAYAIDQIRNQGAGETIAVITAFDHPRIEADLRIFNTTFGLRPCTRSNACFRKVYASARRPGVSPEWALETALDVEWAHAIAPKARILLVEARGNTIEDLFAAIAVAIKKKATVVSMSWGKPESSSDSTFLDHQLYGVNRNVSFIASAGNSGPTVFYPAASPLVLAVGGSRLVVDYQGQRVTETAWTEGSGGLSAYQPAPIHQQIFPLPENPGLRRGVPDVAYHADPEFGFAVFSSISPMGRGWFRVGGTSTGAPQWAGITAIANATRRQAGKKPFGRIHGVTLPEALYRVATGSPYGPVFFDIVLGSNGGCGTLCAASIGYDYLTGLGSPNAEALVRSLKEL